MELIPTAFLRVSGWNLPLHPLQRGTKKEICPAGENRRSYELSCPPLEGAVGGIL
jgi:hypothetical protein